ncbi:sentrin-specific protease 8 isoform X1 [Parasteatoda tepidariorum]|uniref:sentrin-specific protease 8 isoform X1 n=1 Tax=Parasteatoda tepidariorum TaxID=114398 RepID=UPI00077FA50C|nr:sentrin-specific protease 8 isoform X1 [Parasteatoda tepidariorum]XP_042905604.1 sentrin-specific protease 8 isoform X1 [Parasteatoda tepidariorum]
MSSCDPVILSYENSLLRQSDVELLNATNWLNDNIIAFWFEYLEYDIYKDHKDVFGFVCPQVVQYLKFAPAEEVKSTIDGLELNKKQLVFFPVNDCRAQTIPGGTHWSLLVYKSSENLFQHYDSYSCSSNLSVAEHLAEVLFPFLRNSSTAGHSPNLQEMVCAQQMNSYDCGMHVICNTDGLCKKYLNNDPRSISEIVPSSLVSTSRGTLKDLIYSLKK